MITDARIAYAPYSRALDLPGDRRRFCFYARARQLSFEVADAPSRSHEIAVVTSTADITAWARAQPSTRVIYDLVDSYLALPRYSPTSLGRGLAKRLSGETKRLALSYRGAIEAMCRRADAVVCSTDEQRQAILPLCKNTHVILDSHGPEARARKEHYGAHRPFRLVWEGLPHTLPAFSEISDVLVRLQGRLPLELHLVTDLEFRRYANHFGRRSTREFAARYVPNFRLHEWRVETIADIARSCDLAVIPARLGDPLYSGKPENKLLLFWRMAIPAVTSATPAYERTMRAAGLDMTCADADSWERLLVRYIEETEARARAGNQGYRFVTERHSEAALVRRWDDVFASVGFEVNGLAADGS